MSAADRHDVYEMLRPPASTPAAQRASEEATLARALTLFEERPDFGFVWIAYDDETPLACCTVSFAISPSHGGLVARVDDFGVAPDTAYDMIERTIAALGEALTAEEIVRLEATVAVTAASYARALEGMGFRNVHRLTWAIDARDLASDD